MEGPGGLQSAAPQRVGHAERLASNSNWRQVSCGSVSRSSIRFNRPPALAPLHVEQPERELWRRADPGQSRGFCGPRLPDQHLP